MTRCCLVIMPYTVREVDRTIYPESHWKTVYQDLFRPAIEAAGLKCHRDDDDFTSRPIALNIWRKVEEADIILCDVSSSNPNVFIELGWAIRAEKPYVVAMDHVTRVPFDVGDFNRFHYDHTLQPVVLENQIPKLARMLTDTLNDPGARWSITQSLGIVSPALSRNTRPRCTVDIYYYGKYFTREDAGVLRGELRSHAIPCRLLEHSDPGGPDSVFIGSLVEAADARLVMRLIPYEISYLFRPDYPEADGGDSVGYKIGIGYSSKYNEGRRIERAEPIRVSKHQLAALVDEERDNTSFQLLLRDLTVRGVG